MEPTTPDDVTRLLSRARNGDRAAWDALLPAVYDTLRRISRRELDRVGAGDTLSTTDLLHEAYLKLSPGSGVDWRDRAHFYRVASRAMRQVLVERARRRVAEGRKREALRVTVYGRVVGGSTRWEELIALDDALRRLGALSERLHSVVELRFFGGLSEAETASALGLSTRTVRRDWTKARLFLHREIHPEGDAA
jgi:RNA polymerase sigma-70 factor, ECF subfamily